MTPQTHAQHRRTRIGREMAVRLAGHRHGHAKDSARNEALNRLTLQADSNARESFWNRIEVLIAILALAVVEIIRTGG